ncbi:CynX/NimT family MFS transporter [Candidatus Poriferisocius sp.]|uniref:MFS transporter n=1 Tax=Candidatus Poriferisocius sp. TaxID=3101276 RepID=UPI003B598532
MNPHHQRYRWVLLGALWMVYFSFGLTVLSMAPLLETIRADLGISKGAMGAVLGAWPLVYLVSALPAGTLIDKLGLRHSLAIATVIIAISALLRPLAGDFWPMFGAVAMFGLGGPLVSVGAPKLVSVWFAEEERALAMSITLTAPTIGNVLPLVTANSVLMPAFDQNWRTTLLVYALVAVAVIAIWLAAATVAERVAPGADRSQQSSPGFAGAWQLLGLRPVQNLLLMAIGMFFFGHALNGWLPTVIEDRGFASSTAGYLVGAVISLSIVGALFGPRLIPAHRRFAALGAVMSVLGTATILIMIEGRPSTLAGLVLVGLSRGMAAPIALLGMMLLPGVSQRNLGVAGGLFFTAGEIGGVTGPILFGVMADVGGSTAGLVLLTAVAATTAALALALQSSLARAP